MSMLIDTHCHLSDGRFHGEVDGVVSAAKRVGVIKIVVPSSSIKDSIQVARLIKQYDSTWGVVGVHPEAAEVDNMDVLREEITSLIRENDRIVGIGEIGMDGYWNRRNLDKQHQVFGSQLSLAVDLELPAVIHSRMAAKEIREVLERMEKLPRGQFHCFGEDEEFLEYILGRGFYVSVGGNVTFKSAEKIRIIAKKIPLEKLLLETDAPYLAPEGKRGQRNEPANVRITAEFLANLRGIALEELVQATGENAQNLFRLR